MFRQRRQGRRVEPTVDTRITVGMAYTLVNAHMSTSHSLENAPHGNAQISREKCSLHIGHFTAPLSRMVLLLCCAEAE